MGNLCSEEGHGGSSSAGLLGGETRSRLMDVIKEDELLAMQSVLALGLADRLGV